MRQEVGYEVCKIISLSETKTKTKNKIREINKMG